MIFPRSALLALLLGTCPGLQGLTSTITDFDSLQRACDEAAPGSVIDLPAGTYSGQLVLRRKLTLQGPREAVILHPPFADGPTLAILAEGVVLRGFTVSGSGEGSVSDHYAIVVSADGARIDSVAVRAAWGGIYLKRSRGSSLTGLDLEGRADWLFYLRGDAVHVLGGRDTLITGLAMAHWADGVYADQTESLVLRGIAGRDLRYGVHGMFSTRVLLEDCRVADSLVGLMLMESRSWTVRGCDWTRCLLTGGAGLRIVRSEDCDFVACTSARNLTGVQLLDARRCAFSRLRVEENATAFRFGGFNQSCDVGGSSIRGNLVQVSPDSLAAEEVSDSAYLAHDHGTSASQAFGQAGTASVRADRPPSRIPAFMMNYWDDWKGYDLDSDGIGDAAYRTNIEVAALYARHPLLGIFLGSPWRSMVEGLGSGEVIDPRPLVRPP